MVLLQKWQETFLEVFSLVNFTIDGACCDENFTSLSTGADGLPNEVFRSVFRHFLLFETIIHFEFIFLGVKLLSWHLLEVSFGVSITQQLYLINISV